jgi:hypothetical protein
MVFIDSFWSTVTFMFAFHFGYVIVLVSSSGLTSSGSGGHTGDIYIFSVGRAAGDESGSDATYNSTG